MGAFFQMQLDYIIILCKNQEENQKNFKTPKYKKLLNYAIHIIDLTKKILYDYIN